MTATRPRSRLYRRLPIETLAWIALLAFIGYRAWPQAAAAFGVASTNAAAPAFQLTTLDGRVMTSDQLRGSVVLVNFWATWCPPCRVEMPGFQAVYDRNRSRGFVVLGISTDAGGPEAVQTFLAAHHITYPIAMASASELQGFGAVNVLPTSFLIDRQGKIRNEVRGVFASFALARAVDHLLGEAAGAHDSGRVAAPPAR